VLAPLRWAVERYTQALRRVAYPIQNLFASSGDHFQGALSSFWVPIWTRIAHFKGNTPRSISDVSHYVREQMKGNASKPHFVFLNLMETHFPFLAPEESVKRFAPRFLDDPQLRDFMRCLNRQGARWLTPLEEAQDRREAEMLSDMYDAEVAYQDHLLGELLSVLDEPEHSHNTLTVIVADHGEMLGEHQLMGHAFGAYQELVHVPLVVRYPGQDRHTRVSQPVSATRLFHTALDVAGVEAYQTFYSPAVAVGSRSLAPRAGQPYRSDGSVVCEAYPPSYAVRVAEGLRPGVLEQVHCRSAHWAVYEDHHKLVRVDGVGDRLYDLADDPAETSPLDTPAHSDRKARLRTQLGRFREQSAIRRPEEWARRRVLVDDELVSQRLRDLGYSD
jgi:uncharacterized sulfatase